ncbi:hypothetical protein M426DRAFT_11596 [Hypoxylon sp. CI-4A]|nr:hypothetical protein M426DRAFT_11596 [Hypoxylon sp. CI-4A]
MSRSRKYSVRAHEELIGPLYDLQPYQEAFSPIHQIRQQYSTESTNVVSKKSSYTTPLTPLTAASPKNSEEALISPPSIPQPSKPPKRRLLQRIKEHIKSAFSSARFHLRNMSERPLEAIKRANKAANRAPHLRKKNITGTDTIDILDNIGIGGPYHHDGPYDATLASRNRDKRYAPVEAVKYTNSEALKATPRENVVDSLERHVPLQGTAVIPPGERDFAGRIMNYEEGADLMREEDAPGGPYKRWDHVKYHPDDLKGKGEPSYTIEEDMKRQKNIQTRTMDRTGAYEMQPTAHATGRTSKDDSNTVVRERSTSLGSAGPSNSKGKRLSDGIKRRIGSIRRKPEDI